MINQCDCYTKKHMKYKEECRKKCQFLGLELSKAEAEKYVCCFRKSLLIFFKFTIRSFFQSQIYFKTNVNSCQDFCTAVKKAASRGDGTRI